MLQSIPELVQQLKNGEITKEQLLNSIISPQESIILQDSKNEISVQSANSFQDNQESLKIEDLVQQSDPEDSIPFHLQDNDFWLRQMKWNLKKTLQQEQGKREINRQESRECTFHPNINQQYFTKQSDTFLRLSQIRDTTYYDKIRSQMQQQREKEEIEQCTFQPRINQRSKSSKSRYRDLNNNYESTQQKRGKLSQDNFNFIPKVIGPKKGMAIAMEYLQQDPFERLSQPKTQASTDGSLYTETNSQSGAKSYYQGNPNAFSSKPFFERQAIYEMLKQEKKEQSQQILEHKPKICKRSQRLIKKSFQERSQNFLEKVNNRKQYKDELEGCTFEPKITQFAKDLPKRGFDDMSYGDQERRNERVKELTELYSLRRMNPEYKMVSNPYSEITSKLQVLDDPQGYISRISQMQQDQQFKREEQKAIQIDQELENCTHTPVIREAPAYVKRIARTMAMIKSIQPIEESKKPEWR